MRQGFRSSDQTRMSRPDPEPLLLGLGRKVHRTKHHWSAGTWSTGVPSSPTACDWMVGEARRDSTALVEPQFFLIFLMMSRPRRSLSRCPWGPRSGLEHQHGGCRAGRAETSPDPTMLVSLSTQPQFGIPQQDHVGLKMTSLSQPSMFQRRLTSWSWRGVSRRPDADPVADGLSMVSQWVKKSPGWNDTKASPTTIPVVKVCPNRCG